MLDNSKKVNYTVIIPHYNSLGLLEKCVKSIPDRSDIQIIVIDDNSDPNLVDFSNSYLIKRNNVEVIFNKNGKGAGHARNLGLAKSQCKWLLFVDSDDYLVCDSFNVFDKYLNSEADIVYFGVDSIYADTGEMANRHNRIMDILTSSLLDGESCSYEKVRLKHLGPVGKLISKSIVEDNNIKFDEVWYSNDVMFSVQTGWAAKKVLIDLSNVYVITVSRGSLTNRRNLNNYRSRFEVYLRYNKFVRGIGKSKYQMSIMNYYLNIAKYGVKPWWQATLKMIQYRNNPFIGIKNWINTIVKIHKNRKKISRYLTN